MALTIGIFLKKYQKPFIFLDIGANQGLYTIGAARNTYNRASYAFEPVRNTFELLNKNIALNSTSGKCHTHNYAVAEESGSLEINVSLNHSGAARLRVNENSALENFRLETINCISHEDLDELIAHHDLPVLVKVDVEGHEETVIRELFLSKLREQIVDIFYEVDEAWVNQDRIAELMQQNGFDHLVKIGTGSHYDVHASRSDSTF